MIGKPRFVTHLVGILAIIGLALYGLFALLSGFVFADEADRAATPLTVPPNLDYQGYIQDADGTPFSGAHDITFRLYDTIAGDTPLWEETYLNVSVTDGYFSVMLGENTAMPTSLFSENERYLGVRVHPNDEMVPRQKLASVPYAIQAFQAETAILATIALSATRALNADHADLATFAESTDRIDAADGSPTGILTGDNLGHVQVRTNMHYYITHQKDLEMTQYKRQTRGYFVEASKAFERASVPLDMDIVRSLCQDLDGCSITIGMRDWINSKPGLTAPVGPYRLFMSETSNWWGVWNQSGNYASGNDGNGTANTIHKAFACSFTDGEYSNGLSSDNQIGFGLVNWTDYTDPDMVCILLIED